MGEEIVDEILTLGRHEWQAVLTPKRDSVNENTATGGIRTYTFTREQFDPSPSRYDEDDSLQSR
jgi:hypothetical protein